MSKPTTLVSAALTAIGFILLSVASPARAETDVPIDDRVAFMEAQYFDVVTGETLKELLELAGDFGGHASGATEVADRLEPEFPSYFISTRGAFFEAFQPAAREAAAKFWSSPAGLETLRLRGLAYKEAGRRDLARRAERYVEKLEPERLQLLRELDQATEYSATNHAVAGVLFVVVEALADQVAEHTGHEPQWKMSQPDMLRHIDGPYRDAQRRAFYYALADLDEQELRAWLEFARSPGGVSYYRMRKGMMHEWASLISDTAIWQVTELLESRQVRASTGGD